MNEAPLIASALDPHYHQLKFLTDSQHSLVYAVVKEKVAEMFPQSEESMDTGGTTDSEAVPKRRKLQTVYSGGQEMFITIPHCPNSVGLS